jgi:hypothetical protein
MNRTVGDARRLLVSAALAFCPAAIGCGGGLPLLHPAQTLAPGEVQAAGGFSANVATGGLADALKNAEVEATSNGGVPSAPGTDPTYARGALVAASVGPGLAPFGGARVGVGAQVDGGLAYTGRAIRADFRRSFDLSPRWALSVGAGGSAALYGHQNGVLLPNVDIGELHGWGADVPVLIGYESEGDLYMLWLGARGGWEHVDISEVSSDNGATLGQAPISLSATRFWGGALLGFAVGFRHLHVAVELDASYASVTGDYNETKVQVSGVTVTPASALWWRF